jgi:UDPglucose 6-dehydrogenase
MKIAVAGLWHLGSVTAGCLAHAGHDVVGFDDNAEAIAGLRQGRPPVSEPGLAELLQAAMQVGKLSFSSDLASVSHADVVWITYDTPVDAEDRADSEFVYSKIERLFPYFKNDALVLISSQLPVGSTRRMEEAYAKQFPDGGARFACSPENLRLGKAIEVFTQPDRVVVGVRTTRDKECLAALFKPITDKIVWMSVESAEMTKHAINAFLATSVTFINELATICERVGADAREVEKGLKSEARIGPKAYLKAGGAFAGGTLARDISFLIDLAAREQLPAKLFEAVKASNEAHRDWARRKLLAIASPLTEKRIAVLGLTYKPGTSTLRSSGAVELCRWLHENGASVTAFDPKAEALSKDCQFIQRRADPMSALSGADAAVVGTEWPEFKTLDEADVLKAMRQAIVLDASGFLAGNLNANGRIRYITVGTPGGKNS